MQEHSQLEKFCEICKFEYKLEKVYKSKCDPKIGCTENPHMICYLGIVILIKAVLIVLIYVFFTRGYVNTSNDIAYFIGIIAILLFSLSCSTIITISLCKRICFIQSDLKYKIHPLKDAEDNLNTTNFVHSVPRLESISQADPSSYLQELGESNQALILK